MACRVSRLVPAKKGPYSQLNSGPQPPASVDNDSDNGGVMKKNHDIIEVAAELRRETERAFLLYDGSKEAWVPKAKVEDDGDGTFSMPEWLAMDKGFI